MKDEQLCWSFDGDEVVDKSYITDIEPYNWEDFVKDPTPTTVSDVCKHKVIFRACKKGYVTYCNKCGKILSVRNRKEK